MGHLAKYIYGIGHGSSWKVHIWYRSWGTPIPFLDPKDLRNWLCHSSSVTDVFKTENHCLVLDNFKIQPQLYSMVKYSWLDLIIMVGFNYIEGNRDSLL